MRLLPIALLAACSGAPAADKGGDDTAAADDTAEDTAAVVTPRIAWFDDVMPVDVSPDGSTALLQRASSLEGEVLLLDTATDELRSVTTVGDATRDLATGLSGAGHVSALHGVPVEAGVWSEGTGWVDLVSPYAAGCDADHGGAFDVSDDGGTVVGLMWENCSPAAFRWTAAGGVEALARVGEAPDGSPSPPTNRATVVSGDGRVVAGFAAYGPLDRSPARWDADGVGTLLAPDDRDQTGEVLSIDTDGSTLGVLRGVDGYVWTEAGGFTALGRLDTALPTDPVYPNALTGDGAVAFGGVGSEFFTVPTAFAWTDATGMRAVQEVLAGAGVTVPEGYWLTSVMAVSDDGTVLLGRAYDPDGAVVAYVAHVPAETWGR